MKDTTKISVVGPPAAQKLEEEKEPAGAVAAGQSRVPRSRKFGILWCVTLIISILNQFNLVLRIIVILLIGISIVIGLWPYAASHYRPHFTSTIPAILSTLTVGPTFTPTPGSIPSPPPTIGGSYHGTIYNIPMNAATTMSLTEVELSQGTVRGHFSGLSISGSFKGTLNTSTRHILFTVTDRSGKAVLSFDGSMQSNEDISGSYCTLNRYGQCAGEYGIWSIASLLIKT